jgi:hypothetical protein
VVSAEAETANVGELKKLCCDHCQGEGLIELDHDDMLTPGTLPRIARAFRSGAGFVYSDVACWSQSHQVPVMYASSHGWESYPIEVYGRRLSATKCFPVSARSLCEIYYAPDHLRAWHRQVYERTGGHDPSLSVGDDHDLMCRTYVDGTPWHHIGRCGYIYRFHAGNTVKDRNARIQEQVAANRRHYLQRLIEVWSDRHRLPRLDLERWWDEGHWRPGQDIQVAPNQLGQLSARGVFPYLDGERLDHFMAQAHQALAPGGHLTFLGDAAQNQFWPRPLERDAFNPYLEKYQVVDAFEWTNHRGERLVRADLCALKGQRHPATSR